MTGIRKLLGTVLLGGAASVAPFFVVAQDTEPFNYRKSDEFFEEHGHWPSRIDGMLNGSDSVWIERGDTPYSARLTYVNSKVHGSNVGYETVSIGDIIVDVYVKFGDNSAETCIPVPRNGYVSIPAQQDVADGELGFEFLIVPSMY